MVDWDAINEKRPEWNQRCNKEIERWTALIAIGARGGRTHDRRATGAQSSNRIPCAKGKASE